MDARDGVCPQCLFNLAAAGIDQLVSPSVFSSEKSQSENQKSNLETVLHSFGDYELLEEIARGGMGAVYKARQKSLGRLVAVKLILAGQFAGKQVAQRFKSEAIAAAVLQHPNIVAIHEVGVHQGQHFFSMDYVEGQNLTERIAQRPLPPREAARYVKLIAEAIHYAHGQGILHRDLKPSNVLIDAATDQPRVTDFGLAKWLDGESSLTVTGQVLGSPHFMPPEQAGGKRGKVGRPSDVFGLGGILYFLLTARAPFQGETMEATIEQVLHTEPVSPRSLNLAVSRDLETICLKCLEKEPTRRYQTAEEVAEELERFLNGEPIVGRPVSQVEKIWRWCCRKPLVASLSGATLALLLSVAIGSPIALYRINQERERAELAREETRRRAYAAEISTGFQALAENNLARAIDLLNRQRPKPGEVDLRGFEWRYLWQQCQSDEKITFRDRGASGLAFSPDGKWLACGDDKILIRELPSYAVVATVPQAATTLAFSPQGKLLASGHDSNVKLWSTKSWREERTLPDARYPVVFSPDGRWLVTGTPGGYRDGKWVVTGTLGGYRVWSTKTWEPAGFCEGGPTFTYQSRQAVAFSPDGKLLVTAGHKGGREVGQFQVWDFPSLTPRTNFTSFPFKLVSAAFAPDGQHLLIGDNAGGLMVWNVAEGRVVDTRRAHTGAITAINYARDGQTFATASADRTVILWDAPTREMLVRLRGHLEEVSSVAMSPDGRMLASRSRDGTTKLWDASTRHERRMLPGCGLITGFSTDSRLLVVQGYRPDIGFKGYRLWRLSDGTVTTIPLENYAFRGTDAWGDVHGLEPYAVFGRFNGVLEHWNLATVSRVASWRVHEGEVKTAAFSPDGQFIATRGEEGDVKLWQTRTHREVRRFETLREKLTPNWNVLTFSPNGRLLAASGGKQKNSRVCIWDVNSGRLLCELDNPGHEGVAGLAFSPDSKLLATASFNNTAQLWEVPSGNLRATLKGHVQAVMAVAFSPDGRTLVTGGDDGKVKLWNVATQQEMATLELLRGGCRALRFSPDGRTLAVASFLDPEPYIWLWEVPSFEEIAAAEAKKETEIKQP